MNRTQAPLFAVQAQNLSFGYEPASPILKNLSFELPRASRTLLVGANGVGKTTLLHVIAGHHLLNADTLRVFERSPFHDPISNQLALVDGDFPIDVDLKVSELLAYPTPSVQAHLEKELLDLLSIDPGWRMHRISEGQRRRVQLLLNLRRNVDLLLLDEVTAHLDLIARADFLAWVRSRSEKDGLTVLYTTHILDGLWNVGLPGLPTRTGWPTHLMFMSQARPLRFAPVEEIPELGTASLFKLCEDWIRGDARRA